VLDFTLGVVLFWCAAHRICLGYIILRSAESCDVVFEVLTTRFRKMPKYVIYDNGCNLFEYCHNRAPTLFKATTFVSDAFHWVNHSNCASFFDPKM
jgi:hypothetical protein